MGMAKETRLSELAPGIAARVTGVEGDKDLRRRVLDGLGLAKRAGDLISGFEKVAAALSAGKAAWLIEAADGAADGRRKISNVARKSPNPPQVLGLFTAEELGLALGGENVIHTAFLAGRGAGRWTEDVRKLAGFSPLLPESWREEKPSQAGGT